MSFLSPDIQIVCRVQGESAPIVLPDGMVDKISSSRNLDYTSIGVTLKPGTSSKKVADANYLFQPGTVVELYVREQRDNSNTPFRLLNVGHVSSRGRKSTFRGAENSFNPTIIGLQQRLAAIEYFIELVNPDDQGASSYTQSLTAWSDTLSEGLMAMDQLALALWDNIIVKLLSPPGATSYGGRDLLAPAVRRNPDSVAQDAAQTVSANGNGSDRGTILNFMAGEPGYTEGFVHAFQFASQFRTGQSPNLWQMLTSILQPPLYELILDPVAAYDDIGGAVVTMVLRRTPFLRLFNDDGTRKQFEPGEIQTILNPDHVDTVDDLRDIYAGVHVGLSQYGPEAAAWLPAKWNQSLVNRYGRRPLQVSLHGVSAPPGREEDLETERRDLGKAVADVRDMLFNIFCGGPDGDLPLRHTERRIVAPFRRLQIGEPTLFLDADGQEKVGYCYSVEDEFAVRPATARTTASMKWVDADGPIVPNGLALNSGSMSA